MAWTSAALVALVALSVGVSGKNRYGERRSGKNGRIYNDFYDGSGDDSGLEDVYTRYDSSGDGMSFMTECHRQQMEAREQHRPTAYVPECTDDGEFSPKQCHMAIHQCWCVYTTGRKVPGTERMSSLRLHCHKLRDPNPPSRKTSLSGSRNNVWLGATTNGPSLKADDVILVESKGYKESKNKSPYDGTGEINIGGPDGGDYDQQDDTDSDGRTDTQERRMAPTHSLLTRPGLLAACVGLAVTGLVLAVTVVMFIVYRMRKKDEGSYALDEPKTSPTIGYTKTHDREFFA